MLNVSVIDASSILLEELTHIKCLKKVYVFTKDEKVSIQSIKIRYMHIGSHLRFPIVHNIALRESAYQQTELHLIIKNGVLLKAEDIDAMHDWMLTQPLVGQLMPRMTNAGGTLEYLPYKHPVNTTKLSDCFMLLQTKAAVESGLFDEHKRIFRDVVSDLTFQIHQNYLTLYYPQWTIINPSFKKPLLIDRLRNLHRPIVTALLPSVGFCVRGSF